VICCEAGLCHGQSTWCFLHPLSSVVCFSLCLHARLLSHNDVNDLYSSASSVFCPLCFLCCIVPHGQCPCLCCIQCNTPDGILYDSFLQIHLQFACQQPFLFHEGLLCHCYSASDISLTVSILWNDRSHILEMIHLLNLLSIYKDLYLPTPLSWNAHHFRFLHIDFHAIILSHLTLS